MVHSIAPPSGVGPRVRPGTISVGACTPQIVLCTDSTVSKGGSPSHRVGNLSSLESVAGRSGAAWRLVRAGALATSALCLRL